MQQKLIYVVDDHPSNLLLLKELLAPNYDVRCFESAEEGLLAITDVKPDLVLLDIMLPGMSGYDTIASINSIDGYADIPIIIISGKTDETDVQAGINLGAKAYICKPFDIEEVILKVDETMALS